MPQQGAVPQGAAAAMQEAAPGAEVAMLEMARADALSALEQLEAAVVESRCLERLNRFREAHEHELALARSREERRAALGPRAPRRPPRAAQAAAEPAKRAGGAAEDPAATPPPCGLAIAIPTSVLRQILLTGTTHSSLATHVAVCAQVHPEWRRVVRDNPAYLAVSDKRADLLRPITAAVQGPTPSLQILARSGAARIRLGGQELGCDGAAALGAVLGAMGTPLPVSQLDLSACGLVGAGIGPIATALRQTASAAHGRLQSLSLAANPALGDAGLAAIAAAIPPSLTELDVSEVGAGDEGMAALARALTLNALTLQPMATLRKLACSGAPLVGTVGSAALADALIALCAAQLPCVTGTQQRQHPPPVLLSNHKDKVPPAGWLHLSVDRDTQRAITNAINDEVVRSARGDQITAIYGASLPWLADQHRMALSSRSSLVRGAACIELAVNLRLRQGLEGGGDEEAVKTAGSRLNVLFK
jgi:hypothetical protein